MSSKMEKLMKCWTYNYITSSRTLKQLQENEKATY